MARSLHRLGLLAALLGLTVALLVGWSSAGRADPADAPGLTSTSGPVTATNPGTTTGQSTTTAPAPAVTINPVTATGQTNACGYPQYGPNLLSATFNATINPQGSATTYYFEYGPSPAYGQTTTVQTLAAGDSPANVSAALTNLPEPTYYAVVATNANGTTIAPSQGPFFLPVAPCPAPQGVGTTVTSPQPPPPITLTVMAPRIARRGTLSIRFHSSTGTGTQTWRASVTVKTSRAVAVGTRHGKPVRRVVRLASATYTLPKLAKGKSTTHTLKLTRAGLALLKREHRLPVSVAISARQSAGPGKGTALRSDRRLTLRW